MLAAGDGERLLPPAAQAFAIVCGDDQAAVACRPAFGIIRETRSDFVAWGSGLPAGGWRGVFLRAGLLRWSRGQLTCNERGEAETSNSGKAAGRTSFACILLPDGTPLDEGLARVLALMGTTPECFASFGDHGGLING